MGAPRQSAMPTHRGRPRLPTPALRRAVSIERPVSGMHCEIAAQIVLRRGLPLSGSSIFFQNFLRSLSGTTASSAKPLVVAVEHYGARRIEPRL